MQNEGKVEKKACPEDEAQTEAEKIRMVHSFLFFNQSAHSLFFSEYR